MNFVCRIDDIITMLHIVTYIIVHFLEIFILVKAAQEIHIQASVIVAGVLIVSAF